ncbi:MAG TPA: hypothetical protein VGH38_23810 [Bryobacteraceae bacterium]|jgi:hypothetical protein
MLRVIFAIFAFSLPLCAQSWDELHSLVPGDRINVLDTTGKELKGTFRAVSADAITVASGQSETAIERLRVRRVQVRSSSRRVRNAVIGVAIGLAIGVAVDQTLGTYLRNESGDSGRAATYAAPIALFGGVGALLPPYRTVYRLR